MKVILLRDVPKVGHKYQIVQVADGFATNALLPKGLAEQASEKALKRVEAIRAQEEAERKIREDLLLKNLHDISGVTIEISGKANDKGHLFKGIHKEEIVPALKEQSRLDIDAHFIDLEKPIKEVGEHKIKVAVQDKSAEFTLNIVAA